MKQINYVVIIITFVTLTALLFFRTYEFVISFGIAIAMLGALSFLIRNTDVSYEQFEKRIKELETKLNGIAMSQGFKK